MRRAVLLLSLLSLAAGCRHAGDATWTGSGPAPQRHAVPVAQLWPHVHAYLEAQGLQVEQEAEAQHALTTAWRDAPAVAGAEAQQERLSILALEDGKDASRLWVVRSLRPKAPGGLEGSLWSTTLSTAAAEVTAERAAAEAASAPGGEDIARVVGLPDVGGVTTPLAMSGERDTDEKMRLARAALAAHPTGQDEAVERVPRARRDAQAEAALHAFVAARLQEKRAPAAAAQAAPPPEVAVDCGLPVEGLPAPAPGGAVLLGVNIHGVREVPQLVQRAACASVKAGVPVLVAMELPASLQPDLDAYVASAGDDAARAALLAHPFWHSPYPDGRSSEAMLALLEGLRGLREAGGSVRLVAFDYPRHQGNARASRMTRRLLTAMEELPGRWVLAVGGNQFMRAAKGADWSSAFEPVGLRLAEVVPRVTTLDMVYGSGTAWVCSVPTDGGKKPRCKVRQALGEDAGGEPFIRAADAVTEEGFHGFFYTGPLTASLPVFDPGAATVTQGK